MECILNKILIAILFFLVLGCDTTRDINTQNFIENNYATYVNVSMSSLGCNDNINAILKSFNSNLALDPPQTWDSVKNRNSNYLDYLKSNNISSNYPVRATSYEIEIVGNFMNDLINYGIQNNIKASSSEIVVYLREMSVSFIIKINDYEYSKANNK